MSGWDYAPLDHSRVSNINFDIWISLGDTINIPSTNAKGRQSSFPLGTVPSFENCAWDIYRFPSNNSKYQSS
jgi:hypothetical protein